MGERGVLMTIDAWTLCVERAAGAESGFRESTIPSTNVVAMLMDPAGQWSSDYGCQTGEASFLVDLLHVARFVSVSQVLAP